MAVIATMKIIAILFYCDLYVHGHRQPPPQLATAISYFCRPVVFKNDKASRPGLVLDKGRQGHGHQ